MKYFAATLMMAAGVTAQTFDAGMAVTALITSTGNLKTQVDAYMGGDPTQLQAAAKMLVDQITMDDTQIKAAMPLTQDQALALAGPVQNLVSPFFSPPYKHKLTPTPRAQPPKPPSTPSSPKKQPSSPPAKAQP